MKFGPKTLVVFLVAFAVAAGIAAWTMQARQTPKSSEKEETDGPDKAFEWRRLAWLSEDGKIAADGFQNAMAQRSANVEASGDSARDATTNPWVFRGPSNIGGRTRGLIVGSGFMIAGSVSGGIWRSTDGGVNWTNTSDWLPSLAIGCLTRDPNNPNTIYAGTGEGFFNGDAIGGVGILKSKDQGLTWNLMPSTSDFGNVCRIAVAPGNSNLLLASIRYGGIRRSTDGGVTWSTPLWTQGSYYVAFHPTNASKAIAQVIDYDWGIGNWFHRALYSNDGGATWTPSTGLDYRSGFGSRIELAYTGDGSKVYASVADASGGNIWKSNDGGMSYSQVASSTNTGVSWYANPIWVDPTNENLIVTGGYHLYRSTNGGATFTQISDGYINTTDPHPDQHGIIADPGYNGTSNRRIYAVTDGGTYTSSNIASAAPGSTWARRERTYNTTQFYGAAGHGPTNRIAGGTQDNGTFYISGSNTSATLIFGGDGGWTQIDPVAGDYTYGEYIALQIHRSTSPGGGSSYIYNGLGDAGNNANFIAPFIIDVNERNRMLAGGRSLWRSNNVRAGVPTWSAIRPAGTDNISAIAVAPGNSDIVWVGQNNGEVARTTTGTAATPTWITVDNNGSNNPFPNRYITRIVVDPQNSNTVYVALGGFDPDNVWKSTNGGATWTDVTGAGSTGLPNAPVRGFAVHPTNSKRLYAGTEVGVFTSSDGGVTWTTNDFGPANVSTDEVVFMHSSQTLLAATHGRGLWTLDQTSPAGKLSAIVTLGNWNAPPVGQIVTVEFYTAGTNTLRNTRQVTLGTNGSLTILDPGVPTGTYDIFVKGLHWLRKKIAGKVLTDGNLDTFSATLTNGDVDGDNVVSVFDYIFISDAFDTSAGDAGFDIRADLDGDGVVSVFDYIILSDNFDKSGD